jgi:hypothetical protein
MEELQALAKLVKSEGRISVTRLAQEATKLLNLQPASAHEHASNSSDANALDELLA